MTKFRISETGKRIITVDAMVNRKGPFNFVVDTGASHTVISIPTAEKLGIYTSSQDAATQLQGDLHKAPEDRLPHAQLQ